MGLKELHKLISDKEAKLAIIGMGYVGLPVACVFAKAGFNVLGVDINASRIAQIHGGILPIEGDEPGLQDLLTEVVSSHRLETTTNYKRLQDRDILLICVETPVDDQHIPRYEALQECLKHLGPNLKDGALVVVESTVAPGTMEKLVKPAIENGSGKKVNQTFFLGHCPERVMPGKLLHNLRSLSRVVGGMTEETAQTMAALYRQVIGGDLDVTDCVTAELVKTTENAYRDVQIAFANEVALIAEAVGGDVWRVRELVNKSPGRQMLLPGAGVGGHCIPKDPWLLVYGASGSKVPVQLIAAAREINDFMPLHVVDLLVERLERPSKQLNGTKILIMGYSYLEDTDDIRNTPSQVVARVLRELGAEVIIHDPYIKEYQGDLFKKANDCDAAVLMVKHREYVKLDLKKLVDSMRGSIIIDGRGLFRNEIKNAEFAYAGVGVGAKKA